MFFAGSLDRDKSLVGYGFNVRSRFRLFHAAIALQNNESRHGPNHNAEEIHEIILRRFPSRALVSDLPRGSRHGSSALS